MLCVSVSILQSYSLLSEKKTLISEYKETVSPCEVQCQVAGDFVLV